MRTNNLKCLVALPLLAASVMGIANPLPANAAGTGQGVAANDSVRSNGESVYDAVEEMAVFPGGTNALLKYLTDSLRYPVEAMDEGIQGRVLVGFVVENDGSVTNESIVRSVHPMLDAEALRVVRIMPKWIPGKINGKPVAQRCTIPLVFRLQDKEVKSVAVKNEPVYKTVDEMPSFPGGVEAVLKYLSSSTVYPKELQKSCVEGRTVVAFTVEKDGSVSDVKTAVSVHPYLDDEAERVVRSMPRWIPGKNNGEPVRVRLTIPISFRVTK